MDATTPAEKIRAERVGREPPSSSTIRGNVVSILAP
jgi:hypothetical protein